MENQPDPPRPGSLSSGTAGVRHFNQILMMVVMMMVMMMAVMVMILMMMAVMVLMSRYGHHVVTTWSPSNS